MRSRSARAGWRASAGAISPKSSGPCRRWRSRRGFWFPADQLGTTGLADHHRAAVSHIEVGDIEGEDLLGSGGALIQQPPQRLVAHRMLGGQEGQQLGLGNGPGAGVVGRT